MDNENFNCHCSCGETKFNVSGQPFYVLFVIALFAKHSIKLHMLILLCFEPKMLKHLRKEV